MHITGLKLLGFKSFVEPTELIVEPGLTGVVGPNGCGKSNLLEALRWVMGETSFKNMRGSAMDDVIFSGTNTRPRRESAEVSIVLDNGSRTAPAQFNDAEIIEVTRRISREAGSQYKINGNDVRARDVQLLFADAATGARSPALVQQGRIGEIVNAKPQARRRVLEEAAGITGLYSRRHEAELRLRAAEGNLERLHDVIGQIGSQLSSLKRQARQAKRYRELSSLIQQTEAIQCHLTWTASCEALTSAEDGLQDALTKVGTLTKEEAAAIRNQSEAAEAIVPLRTEEATRAAVLHRLEVERDTIDNEETQVLARQNDIVLACQELDQDLAREKEYLEEAANVSRRLEKEVAAFEMDHTEHGHECTEAREAADEIKLALDKLEVQFNSLAAQYAQSRAQHDQLSKVVAEQGGNAERLREKIEYCKSDIAATEAVIPAEENSGDLLSEIAMLTSSVGWLEDKSQEAERATQDAQAKEQALHDQFQGELLEAQRLETEVATLTKLLKPSAGCEWTPVIDQLDVTPGYERALGAALGDDLDASTSEAAPTRWSVLHGASVLPPVPIGCSPLSDFVKGPDELIRRLNMVGVLEYGDGPVLQPSLGPGQRLVTKNGDLWRWDGYSSDADAPTPAAVRMAERNRLTKLEAEMSEARAAADATETALKKASETFQERHAEEKKLRDEWRDLQAKLGAARDKLAESEAQTREVARKLAGLQETEAQSSILLKQAETAKRDAEEALSKTDPPDELEQQLAETSRALDETRRSYNSALEVLAKAEQEAHQRDDRLNVLGEERARWQNRKTGADKQIASLSERLKKARKQRDELEGLPEKIVERRQKILSEISSSEAARKEAADQLQAAESWLRDCDNALKDLQRELAGAREERVRIEARLEGAREKLRDQTRLIRDTLNCQPEACLALTGLTEEDEMPPLEEINGQLVKLKGDRERLGGVNLRAEQEAEEIEAQVGDMEKEKVDLEEAIAKLRQGISNLNREGRKRLLQAFEQVDTHFRRLFAVLFGGGEAKLQLVDSDDPLEAGLEIIARPPGKKAQVLTLLSGGEKALTALSLIFAVFLTNPSPICVLDEVDAPLDDANVDRFCTMMEEMRDSTDTRFLVITHHPMTMARMNRLFGVTMAERGVSQLVSVDLATAEGFREAS